MRFGNPGGLEARKPKGLEARRLGRHWAVKKPSQEPDSDLEILEAWKLGNLKVWRLGGLEARKTKGLVARRLRRGAGGF